MKKFFVLALVSASVGCSTHREATGPEVLSEALDERGLIHYDVAFQNYRSGDLIPALASAMKAVELAPRNADARNLLGLIYFRQAKRTQAEEQFTEAVRLDPTLSEAWNNLGTIHLSNNSFEKAKTYFLKAQENPLYLYPERISNNIGLAYEGMGQFMDAEQSFLEATRLNPKLFLPYQNLGKLYLLKLRQTAKAISSLEKAVELCPDCSEAYYYLGQAYQATGKQAQSLRAWKQAVQVDPDGYFGKLCQESLSSGNNNSGHD